MLVITYRAPNGATINLTQAQAEDLERAGTWPRNSRGEEYCDVSFGLHRGIATYTDEQIHRIIAEHA